MTRLLTRFLKNFLEQFLKKMLISVWILRSNFEIKVLKKQTLLMFCPL